MERFKPDNEVNNEMNKENLEKRNFLKDLELIKNIGMLVFIILYPIGLIIHILLPW